MKLIVAGSRDFNNFPLLVQEIGIFIREENAKSKVTALEIISGCARGADRLGIQYAEQFGFKLTKVPADWDKFGKRAGYLRNVAMADIASHLILFWDGLSRGSKHMLEIANKKTIITKIIYFKNEEHNKLVNITEESK